MPEDILKKIINKKTERLINLKKKHQIKSIEEHTQNNIDYVNFKESIKKNYLPKRYIYN